MIEIIDAENALFNHVATGVRAQFPNTFITGEYVKAPPSFPCVSLVEMDNAAHVASQDSGSLENHADLMYEVNVYSNKKTGKKAECKALAGLVDGLFAGLNFTRIMLQPIPNLEDATIYRMLGRYRAVISKNLTLFRR